MLFADLLPRRARLTPDREALYDLGSGVRYSYAELNQRANRAANLLHQQFGLQPGDRVSILAHNHIAFVDLLFGLAKIGAILAPLNWRLTAAELTYIVNDCRPKVILVGPECAGLYDGFRAHVAPHQHIFLSPPPPELGEGGPGGEGREGGRGDERSGSSYPELLNAAPPTEPALPLPDPEDPCCILYTSGTTGSPKGAILPQRQLFWNAVNTVISWGLSECDVSPILTPLFHAGGLFVFLTPLFYAGGRIVLAPAFDPDESLRLIQAEKCTVILGVPTLFQVWMNTPAFAAADFSHVHFFISGGAPCPPDLIRAWRERKGVVVRQGYGLTEAGVNCFSMTDEEALTCPGSVGKPIFHSDIRLVDAAGDDVPPGQAGELLLRGPHLCLGYWERPAATAEALRAGWLHTGDIARQDENGYIYIAGRLKDMIISGGENVYAAEVEAIFRQHPAVTDAALIGLPDEKWGEVGLMFVALQPGQSVLAAELLEFCATRLAKYKIPKQIEFLSALPYSPYGKVIKTELRKLAGVV